MANLLRYLHGQCHGGYVGAGQHCHSDEDENAPAHTNYADATAYKYAPVSDATAYKYAPAYTYTYPHARHPGVHSRVLEESPRFLAGSL